MKWILFNKGLGHRQKLPPLRKDVLVLCEETDQCAPKVIAVGYREDHAGDPQQPYFVTPGIGGNILAWCDCLPKVFIFPYEFTK